MQVTSSWSLFIQVCCKIYLNEIATNIHWCQLAWRPQDNLSHTNHWHCHLYPTLKNYQSGFPAAVLGVLHEHSLTFWYRNFFLNFSTPCIYNVNNTGTKYVRIMKQIEFWRKNDGECTPCLKYSVPMFVE